MASAHVVAVERATDEDGTPIVNVQVDEGGGVPATLELALAPGEDCPPLPGDVAAPVEDGGTGSGFAVGFQDTKNAGKAENGERRTYARDAAGEVVCEIWQHGDGTVEITSIKAGGTVKINGVEIDQQGNIKTPGEVTAMASATPVKLSTHTHLDSMGGTAPPTPGT